MAILGIKNILRDIYLPNLQLMITQQGQYYKSTLHAETSQIGHQSQEEDTYYSQSPYSTGGSIYAYDENHFYQAQKEWEHP